MSCFELCCKAHFSAAHFLRGYNGDCARLHGHNWHVRLYVKCEQLDKLGMGIDYAVMKRELKQALACWDHYHLNEIPPFDRINPTSENVAAELYKQLRPRLENERLTISRIEIAETCTASVTYWP
ncbi:MAG: 6-carboxytetrahydropterin synthase QueD [Zetaproteobacteria bacterium]|nr:MAG: 6-carboxytetrahydropterin synthase QueD [Zetaproteobacteria bacterium]